MANTDVSAVLKSVLRCAAAGFAFGEVALFAAKPSLENDKALLAAATSAAARIGCTGVAVLVACLMWTSVCLSIGSGFFLTDLLLQLQTEAGMNRTWITKATTRISLVVGSIIFGVILNNLPLWIYLFVLASIVIGSYLCNVSAFTKPFLMFLTTLYISVACGRMGFIIGIFGLFLITVFFFGIFIVLPEHFRQTPRPPGKITLMEEIFFYTICVMTPGFLIGLDAGKTQDGSEVEVVLILHSVLRVVFLSGGFFGGFLGVYTSVDRWPTAAGKLDVVAALLTSLALRVILHCSSSLGARGTAGGILAAAVTSGMSLGATSFAAKQAFNSGNLTAININSVGLGALVAMIGLPLKPSLLTASELITVPLLAVVVFVLGAPNGPFQS